MLQRILGGTAAGFDSAVRSFLIGRSPAARRRSSTESLDHEQRMAALASIRGLYEGQHDSFFVFPPAPTPEIRDVATARWGADVRASDLRWPSLIAPHIAELEPRFGEIVENRQAAARVFLHDGPARPVAILVHGYRAGQYGVEERVWPIRWLLDRGVDVALFVLPFHAVRAKPGGAPRFPSSDPRLSNEGFRQAIHDLSGLVSFFEQRGSQAIGVMGMSLGAYTASLFATLEPRLAFVVPIIPLASLADIALLGGRFVGNTDERHAQHAALDAVHHVVSPFARPSRVAGDRVLVVAGGADRITPIAQAERLAAHFDAPLTTFVGGHLLQFGRANAFREVGRMLGRLGVFSRAR